MKVYLRPPSGIASDLDAPIASKTAELSSPALDISDLKAAQTRRVRGAISYRSPPSSLYVSASRGLDSSLSLCPSAAPPAARMPPTAIEKEGRTEGLWPPPRYAR